MFPLCQSVCVSVAMSDDNKNFNHSYFTVWREEVWTGAGAREALWLAGGEAPVWCDWPRVAGSSELLSLLHLKSISEQLSATCAWMRWRCGAPTFVHVVPLFDWKAEDDRVEPGFGFTPSRGFKASGCNLHVPPTPTPPPEITICKFKLAHVCKVCLHGL